MTTEGALLIRVLGPICAEVGTNELGLGPLERKVIAVLACADGNAVTVDRLIDAVWNSDPPHSARNRIQALVSSIRRTCGRNDAIVTVPSGYRLSAAESTLDARRFDRLLGRARAEAAIGNSEAACKDYRAALGLWRGSPFDGTDILADTQVAAVAARLEEARLTAIEELMEIELALGRHANVTPELVSRLATHPFRERLREQLMLALFRSGRQSEALATYRQGQQLFDEELGISPGARLQELHRSILAADHVALSSWIAVPEPKPVKRIVRMDFQPDSQDFVGRRSELHRLRSLLLQAKHRAIAVGVTGLGGIGKTSLVMRAARDLAGEFPDGCVVLDLKVNQGTRNMALVLKALGLPDSAIPPDDTAITNLYQQNLRKRRLLLVLDNAQEAADVEPLLPLHAGSAAIVISRSSVAFGQEADLRLDVLDRDEALGMLTMLIGAERVEREREAAQRISRLCESMPLALHIAGTRIAEQPQLSLLSFAERLSLAERRLAELAVGDRELRVALAETCARLEPRAQELLQLLGMLPTSEFPSWMAAMLLDLPQHEADEVLGRLVRACLLTVVYQGQEARYRLHDLVHLYAKEQLTQDASTTAALWRGYTALLDLALAADRAMPTSSFPSPEMPPDWQRLPQLPEGIAAEPAAWFDSEHGLLMGTVADARDRGWHDIAWRVLASTTVVVSNRGSIEAWHRLASSLLDSGRLDPQGRAILLLALGGLLRGRGRVRQAHGFLSEARRTFDRQGDRHRAAIAATQLGMCARALGHKRLGRAAFDYALGRLEASGPSQHRALAHIGLGNLFLRENEVAAAAKEFRSALASLVGDPNRSTEANALLCLGAAHLRESDHEQATGYYAQARGMFIAIGDVAGLANVELLLASAYLLAGDLTTAESHARQAVQTSVDIGDILIEGRAQLVQSKIAAAGQRSEAAEAAFARAVALLEQSGDHHALAMANATRGSLP